MEYVELLSKVQRDGNFREIHLNCCDQNEDSFSFLRVQLKERLLYSSVKGVWAEDEDRHDKKCEDLIALAVDENVDLLLFPEYCISYGLLEKIIARQELWPKNGKLWCLPCQGIPNQEFERFLTKCKSDGQVYLCDEAWAEYRLNLKRFVNALFYLFVAFDHVDSKKKKLCIVPQLKTQHMADGACECEVPGLTTGNLIYHLNFKLATFLCADSLNNEISWQDLQKKGLSKAVFLHPQLNKSPRDHNFCRMRQEMIRHNGCGCYISCNWAENTVLAEAGGAHKEDKISLSWSCVYRKFSGRNGFPDWAERRSNHQKNSKYGLFGGYMRKENTEVWFSSSEEHAILLNIPAVETDSYGCTSIKDICAEKRLCPCDREPEHWSEFPFTYSLLERLKQTGDKNIEEHIQNIEDPYRYPLTETDKEKIDRFFALTLANFHNEILEMNENEEPVAWTLLLGGSDTEEADLALNRICVLIEFFKEKCFPKNMSVFNQEQMFTFIPPEGGKPSANLTAKDRHIIVAYAEDKRIAEKHVRYLLENECHNNKDLLKEYVCVLWRDLKKNIVSLPKVSTDIGRGDPVLMGGDITDGEYGDA